MTWSQRDNNNYEQSALLSTLAYFSQHTEHFLDNFYFKSKRSIDQAEGVEGPAAYVLPASDAELNRQLQLLRSMKLQHVEISQLTEERKQNVYRRRSEGDKPVEETLPAGFVRDPDGPAVLADRGRAAGPAVLGSG